MDEQTKQNEVWKAERMAGFWLYKGNQAAEKGQKEKAERYYVLSQKWHDRMNKYLGNG